jgi:transcriptional regulator with XRE-family HTH domain
MSLKDFIHGALTGGGEIIREAAPLPEKLAELREAAGGSRRAAAKAAGVPESTWRRWERGAAAKAAGVEKIGHAVRARNLSPDAPTDQTIRIQTGDRNSNRSRTLNAAALKLRPGTMDKVKEAYLRGDDAAAAKALIDGIGDHWYRRYLSRGEAAEGAGGGQGGGGSSGGSQGAAGGGSGGGGGGGSDDDGGDYDYDLSSDAQYEGADSDADSDPAANIVGFG